VTILKISKLLIVIRTQKIYQENVENIIISKITAY